jgi:protoporphyrinogen oxidase
MVLGAGMTGLAFGMASQFPVFEAVDEPGGICSSYYVRPGTTERLHHAPTDGEAYRFEIGGGHWIFGGDPTTLQFIQRLAPCKTYYRKSSVYFRKLGIYVPYPLQNHLFALGHDLAAKALAEMAEPRAAFATMYEWLGQSFGETLTKLFFEPFHDLYTAGLHREIAPQDAYKSPVNLALAIKGAFEPPAAVGYNISFIYPQEGLNALSWRMAEKCDLRYGKRATAMDPKAKTVTFADGTVESYEYLFTTLPLNTMMDMTGIRVDEPEDPSTAVLVLNIGALKGPNCPDDHWLYNPDTEAGFHRVGFYSNVDASFLPASQRAEGKGVSIYIERAYQPHARPSEKEIAAYSAAVVKELQDWGYITDAQVVDPTWIETGYTWARPGSNWRKKALAALEAQDIYPVGRYSRWVFQGIADSIRDGFMAGASAKHW